VLVHSGGVSGYLSALFGHGGEPNEGGVRKREREFSYRTSIRSPGTESLQRYDGEMIKKGVC